MEEMTTRMVEIANRISQLETNFVTKRTARMDAEQHVQILTTHQVQAQLTGLIDTKVWESLASWTHLRKARGTTGSQSCCLTSDSWTRT